MDKISLREALCRSDLSQRSKVLVCLLTDPDNPLTATKIREIGASAGLKEIYSWNLTDILTKAKGYVIKLPAGWCLTVKGSAEARKFVPNLVPAPAIVVSLRAMLPSVTSADTQAFLEEAIKAYEYSLFRSAVVLSWVGAISLLYDNVVAKHLAAFNAEATVRIVDKHGNTMWKIAKNKDDLALMKESIFLDIIADLSIIGKNVKEHLKNTCLALRNSSGHPNSFALGKAQVEAHLEHLALNVYQKF